MIDCALDQVGVTEDGHNAGADVEKYLRSVDFQRGASWCAAFVHWVYRSCGTVLTPPRAYAWSPTWFVGRYRLPHGEEPLPADVFGIYYRNLGRIGHVGLVLEPGSHMLTVEGNTGPDGGRDGDGVYIKRRLSRNIHSYARIQ